MSDNKNIGVRLNEETRKKLKYVATRDGRSMNNLVIRLIQDCISQFEEKHGPISPEDLS